MFDATLVPVAARAAQRVRQDRPDRTRARPRRARRRPAVHRRHRARRCATPGLRCTTSATSPASRKSWTAGSRPCIRRSTAACSAARGTDDAVMARARHRADRPAGRQPVSVRSDRRQARLHAATTRSRTSTSAARRCCARRRRTTSTSPSWSIRPTTPTCSKRSRDGGTTLALRRALRRQGLRAHRALRRPDRELARRRAPTIRARPKRSRRSAAPVARAPAAAALRREPAPARRALRRDSTRRAASSPPRASCRARNCRYNNLADADAALECVQGVPQAPACVIVKHANPCGVALGAEPVRRPTTAPTRPTRRRRSAASSPSTVRSTRRPRRRSSSASSSKW